MTESERMNCTNPHEMLQYLGDRASERKLRLLACACARRIWPALKDKRTRKAIEIAEKHADGLAREKQLASAREGADQAVRDSDAGIGGELAMVGDEILHRKAAVAAREVLGTVVNVKARRAKEAADGRDPNAWTTAAMAELEAQTRIVREVFGNPWRRVEAEQAWLTWHGGAVVSLAQAIYAERRFADLPILADALEEAGCTCENFLSHCRGGGEHVLGCWALDLAMGKE
jgi:hypothetical protein